jgi:hypothetical protein
MVPLSDGIMCFCVRNNLSKQIRTCLADLILSGANNKAAMAKMSESIFSLMLSILRGNGTTTYEIMSQLAQEHVSNSSGTSSSSSASPFSNIYKSSFLILEEKMEELRSATKDICCLLQDIAIANYYMSKNKTEKTRGQIRNLDVDKNAYDISLNFFYGSSRIRTALLKYGYNLDPSSGKIIYGMNKMHIPLHEADPESAILEVQNAYNDYEPSFQTFKAYLNNLLNVLNGLFILANDKSSNTGGYLKEKLSQLFIIFKKFQKISDSYFIKCDEFLKSCMVNVVEKLPQTKNKPERKKKEIAEKAFYLWKNGSTITDDVANLIDLLCQFRKKNKIIWEYKSSNDKDK